MLRKTLRAIGWIAAGLVALCVVAYLGALAINWRDQKPNAAAVRLTQLFRDRPAVVDEDNAYTYLRRWELERDRRKKLPRRLREFLENCGSGQRACPGAFDAADGLFEEWQRAESSLLDRYVTLTDHDGWWEATSFSIEESIPAYSGAADGQRLLLLEAREAAVQGDAQAVRVLLERDLRFWRTVLRSSDILISKMVATGALDRHFEWGYRVLRKLPAQKVDAAIPDGWRSEISPAERSMVRCMVGEWMFVSEVIENMSTSRYWRGEETATDRVVGLLSRPLLQPQDSKNRTAEHYWEVAQVFEAPLAHYEDALHRADELTVRTTDDAAAFRIYNLAGAASLANLSSFSDYAARVSDVEGVRRAALLAATAHARDIGAADMPAAIAGSALRDPYTDQPLEWDAVNRTIVFHGLERRERGEHRIDY